MTTGERVWKRWCCLLKYPPSMSGNVQKIHQDGRIWVWTMLAIVWWWYHVLRWHVSFFCSFFFPDLSRKFPCIWPSEMFWKKLVSMIYCCFKKCSSWTFSCQACNVATAQNLQKATDHKHTDLLAVSRWLYSTLAVCVTLWFCVSLLRWQPM